MRRGSVTTQSQHLSKNRSKYAKRPKSRCRFTSFKTHTRQEETCFINRNTNPNRKEGLLTSISSSVVFGNTGYDGWAIYKWPAFYSENFCCVVQEDMSCAVCFFILCNMLFIYWQCATKGSYVPLLHALCHCTSKVICFSYLFTKH